MFSYGFYNSLNGDRKYDAVQISSIFDGLIEDGVYSNIGELLAVVPGTEMSVIVKTGRAWFDHTWSLNDSHLPIDIEEADVLQTRIDAVVLEVDARVEKRENSIKVVKGTPSVNPMKPTLSHSSNIFQHALAYVTVKPGATAITNGDIEIVVGKDETPFVQCPLKTVSIEDLFNQWDAEFNEWFDNVKLQLTDNVVTNLQRQIDEKLDVSDKATTEDIANKVPGKWVSSDTLKGSVEKYSAKELTITNSLENLEAETSGEYISCDQRIISREQYPNYANILAERHRYQEGRIVTSYTVKLQARFAGKNVQLGDYIYLFDGSTLYKLDKNYNIVKQVGSVGGTVVYWSATDQNPNDTSSNTQYVLARSHILVAINQSPKIVVKAYDTDLNLVSTSQINNNLSNGSGGFLSFIKYDSKTGMVFVGGAKMHYSVTDGLSFTEPTVNNAAQAYQLSPPDASRFLGYSWGFDDKFQGVIVRDSNNSLYSVNTSCEIYKSSNNGKNWSKFCSFGISSAGRVLSLGIIGNYLYMLGHSGSLAASNNPPLLCRVNLNTATIEKSFGSDTENITISSQYPVYFYNSYDNVICIGSREAFFQNDNSRSAWMIDTNTFKIMPCPPFLNGVQYFSDGTRTSTLVTEDALYIPVWHSKEGQFTYNAEKYSNLDSPIGYEPLQWKASSNFNDYRYRGQCGVAIIPLNSSLINSVTVGFSFVGAEVVGGTAIPTRPILAKTDSAILGIAYKTPSLSVIDITDNYVSYYKKDHYVKVSP